MASAVLGCLLLWCAVRLCDWALLRAQAKQPKRRVGA